MQTSAKEISRIRTSFSGMISQWVQPKANHC
jgi:hypothetical protein